MHLKPSLGVAGALRYALNLIFTRIFTKKTYGYYSIMNFIQKTKIRQILKLAFLSSALLSPLSCDLTNPKILSIHEAFADDTSEPHLAASPPLSIASSLSEISVTDIAGNVSSIDLTNSETVVLEWFNQECPFVKKIYGDSFVQKLRDEYQSKGVRWITINSTNPDHPDYVAKEKRTELADKFALSHDSIFFDESGAVGKALGAKTTPHFFVLKNGAVLYQGAFDDAADTDSDPKEAKNYVREALDSIIAGNAPIIRKNRPYGCSIKYSK